MIPKGFLFNMLVDFHGTEGPLVVTDMAHTPLAHSFVEAGRSLGYKETDVNSDQQLGENSIIPYIFI